MFNQKGWPSGANASYIAQTAIASRTYGNVCIRHFALGAPTCSAKTVISKRARVNIPGR